ncbi:MAG TPA: carbohydrate ABC transporter permease [Candidatus Limnocylindrales bacterium]|nr:carbohydrate ABC transporter permease [Candidatus Limnocylindrales bacterium]
MATTLDRGLAKDEPVELQIAGSRRRGRFDRVILFVVLVAIALFFIFPLIVVVSASLKYRAEVFQDTGLIPADPGLENYQALFSGSADFLLWFRNSAIVSIVGTALTLLITSLSAYAFARIDFRFKGLLFGILITTLVLPSVMFLVPQYKLIAEIGLYDSLPALVLPGLAGVFGVFFMRQFFLSIPLELEEAAYVDGANRLRTFTSVVLPIAGPALATLAVITFLAFWNDYLWPTIICQNNCTLPPGLRSLQRQFTSDPGLIMTGAVVAALPVLLLYLALQRYIVQSVASSGIKG